MEKAIKNAQLTKFIASLKDGIKTVAKSFDSWLKDQLPNFQWPRKYLILEDLLNHQFVEV